MQKERSRLSKLFVNKLTSNLKIIGSASNNVDAEFTFSNRHICMSMNEIYDFLRELTENNNREWFALNKERYLRIQTVFHKFVENIIAEIATFDPSVTHLGIKDCTYRIYRDIRFSADKRPYKTHMGIFINPPYGKRVNTSGYYIHLEPDNSFVCAGTVCLESKIIKAIRQAIYDNIEEYRNIVESKEFKACFNHLGDNYLKTAPKGFPKDWKHIDYLRPRDFIAMRRLPDDFFCKEDTTNRLHPYLVQAKRFNDFINFTIEDFIEDISPEPLPHIY